MKMIFLYSKTGKVVCYYSSWAAYHPGDGKYDISNIDPFLCTHIVYAFIGLNPDASIRVMDPWFDIENGKQLKYF